MTNVVQSWLEKAKKHAGWLRILGILEIVAGFLAIGSPFAAGLVVTALIGVAFLVAGGARLVGAFLADSFGAGALAFLWGLVTAATGFFFLIRPGIGLETLTLVVAVVMFIDGISRVIMSFKVKPVKGWGWMLVGGVVSVLFAAMVGWEFPESSLWVVGTLAGISLMFNGFAMFRLAGAASAAADTAESG